MSESEPMRSYITRDEFGSFETNIERRFDGVGRGLDMLSSKIDNISGRGTDWKAIFAGLSVFGGFVLMICTLFGWGLNRQIMAVETSTHRLEQRIHDTEVRAAFEMGRHSGEPSVNPQSMEK